MDLSKKIDYLFAINMYLKSNFVFTFWNILTCYSQNDGQKRITKTPAL